MLTRSHSRKPSQLWRLANVAYQATRIRAFTSHPCEPYTGDASHYCVYKYPEAQLLQRRLRTTQGACSGSILFFKQLSFSGDAERDSLKSSSQVRFIHHADSDFIFVGRIVRSVKQQ